MLQGGIEGKSAAGELAFRVANDAIRDAYIKVSEPVISIAHARSSSSVADQEHALEAFRAQEDLDGGGIDVVAIGDELGRHGRVRQHRADDAGIAVRKRAHCVEYMSGVRYAAFNRCYRLFVGRVRMAHRS